MIVLDFETYSDVPIDQGAYKYTTAPNADIICLSYKIDNGPVSTWRPGEPLLDFMRESTSIIYAHNASFDFNVWNNIGVRRYGFTPQSDRNWIDTIALAAAYGLPSKLSEIAEVLGTPHKKNKAGAALIKRLCVPVNGSRPIPSVADMNDFIQYCEDDVAATYDVLKDLPTETLSSVEHDIWRLTNTMNALGLPIDDGAVLAIKLYIEEYAKERATELPDITNGAVLKPTQVKALVTWCKSRGVDIPNMQADTIEEYIERDLPEDVYKVLALRLLFGASAIAKYSKMLNYAKDGVVRDTLQYFGAHTGRWSGRGIQPQNFPRAGIKDPDVHIQKFKNFEPVRNVMSVAKALIRPMICAPDDSRLIVADYSSIENRGVALLSGDYDTLDKFSKNFDQYIDMASFLYNVPEEKVSPEQRQVGKVIILGCGYGMGAPKFREVAAKFKVNLTIDQAKQAVSAYRTRYNKVSNTWYALQRLAIAALRNPGQEFSHHDELTYSYIVDRNKQDWLACKLGLTGRVMYYAKPTINDSNNITFMGKHPKTGKYTRLTMLPGTLLQNATQAVARDVMAHGMLNIHRHMPEVSLRCTVHDEAIGIIKCDDIIESTLDKFCDLLCRDSNNKPWPMVPLKAVGYISQRYKKQ